MTRTVDLQPGHRDIVLRVLEAHAPGRAVLVFGSRAKGIAKKSSDLDLCLTGEETLPSSALLDLKEAFDEAPLPFKVDVVEWAALEDNFRNIVRADGIPL